MSVTITIFNNRQYCDENKMIIRQELPCQCANYVDGLRTNGGDDSCTECLGKGFTEEVVYPFELNIANANFKTLWSALGLDCQAAEVSFSGVKLVESDYGAIDARRVLKALVNASVDLLVKDTEPKGNHIFCGITLEQATRYLMELNAIAQEASRREEKIVWG